ncbi:MAG: pilus assembly protein TadG-related protein [Pseudomonadota bacterium]
MSVSESPIRPRSSASGSLVGRLLNSVSPIRSFQRDEDGSVTAFSLFIFILMILIGGMAVDLMRFETKRAHLQNALDSATLAATNIRGEHDAKALVKDFMSKRGYDPNLISIDVDETYTGTNPVTGDRGELVARTVTADYDLDMNTYFMSMMGFETLGTMAAGGAKEGLTTVEISMVMDVSGSMGGSKLVALKSAAKNFVNKMIDPTRTDLPVSISVVPFNQTVVVPDALLDRLNTAENIVIPVADRAPYDWAQPLEAYPRTAANSQCVRFRNDVMVTQDLEETLEPALNPNYLFIRAITPTQELERMAYYDQDWKSYGSGGAYDRPGDDWNRRCDPTRSPILPFATDIATLETYFDNLQAGGWTANDVGLKWGMALLDPNFRAVVSDMVSDDELPDQIDGRPYDYNPSTFMKVVVLMTDGANTNQYDIQDNMKNGPSRVWYSEQAANEKGPNGEDWSDRYIVDSNENGSRDRDKDEFDGYFVEMPQNDPDERWMRPHRLNNNNDAVLYAEADLPPDAVQLDYTALYDRFAERVVGQLFRDNQVGDYDAYIDHYHSEELVQNGSGGDFRMSGNSQETMHGLCDAAKVKNDILVFTIAFRAGSNAERVMRDCATSDGFYFDANDSAALNQAFETIATTVTTLRLTQ